MRSRVRRVIVPSLVLASIILLSYIPPVMALGYIQSGSAGGFEPTLIQASFGSSLATRFTSGDTLAITVSMICTALPCIANQPVDNVTGSSTIYSKVISNVNTAGACADAPPVQCDAEIWYGVPMFTGMHHVLVNVTFSQQPYEVAIGIYELSPGYGPISNAVGTPSTSPFTTSTSNPFTASEVGIAALGSFSAVASMSFAAGSGYTLPSGAFGSNGYYAAEYQQFSTTGTTNYPFTNSAPSGYNSAEVGVIFGPGVVFLAAQNFPTESIMSGWILVFLGVFLLPWVVVRIFKSSGDVVVTVWLFCSFLGGLFGSMAADQIQANTGAYGYVPWGLTFYLAVSLVVWLIKGGGH